ncbi:MAG: hypothetical protein U1F66_10285 [bacterium]
MAGLPVAELARPQASAGGISNSVACLAAYFDALSGVGATSGLSAKLRESAAAEFGRQLEALPETYRRGLDAQLSRPEQRELLAIASESDPGLFFSQLLNFERRLEAQGRIDAALLLLQVMRDERFGAERSAAAVHAAAERDYRAILGGGSLGARAEFLARRFVKEAADPAMLVGFGAASLAYQGTRLYALSRLLQTPQAGLLTRGLGASLLASAAGLGAEAPSFVLAAKLTRAAGGVPQDWRPASLGQELAATGMTLFFLKGAGALSGRLASSLGGDSFLARFGQRALPQVGMFGGIVLAKRAEEWTGLRASAPGENLLLEGLSTYLQFQVGGRVAEGILGRGFLARQRELDLRAASLAPAPRAPTDLSGLSPVPASAAAPLRIRRASLQELAAAPLLSENHQGNGDGNERGLPPRLRSVTSGEAAPGGEARLAHDPKAFAEEVRQKLQQERALLAEAENALRSFDAKVRTYLVHQAQGRGAAVELGDWHQEILATYDRFLEKYREASLREEPGVPLLAGSLGLQREAMQNRAALQRFLNRAGKVHEEAQLVLRELAAGHPEGIRQALKGFQRKAEEWKGRPLTWAFEEGLSLSEEIRFAKLAGIFQGVGVKEAYRGSVEEIQLIQEHQLHPWNLLARSSLRSQDHQIPEWLAAELRHFQGGAWDPAKSLLVRSYPSSAELPDQARREVSPREILRWGGTYEEPFRTWVGVQVPTLMAVFQGDPVRFAERTRALELFMAPETREAGRIAAWWLGRAVRGEGFPHMWTLQAEASPLASRAEQLAHQPNLSPERAARALGEKGDLAVVGHSLLAFLRHPFDPRAALEFSLNAPPAIREDVVSLTGALLGGFHGRGIFHPEWLCEVILRLVPTRSQAQALREVTEFINKEALLQNALSDLRALSFESKGGGARVMSLREAGSRKESPLWSAFRAGAEERLSNGELVVVEVVWNAALLLEQGEADGASRAEWGRLKQNLRVAIRRLEGTLDSLREFRARAVGTPEIAEHAGLGDFDQRVARLENTLGKLREMKTTLAQALAAEPSLRLGDGRIAVLRGRLLETVDLWDLPELKPLKLNEATSLRLEDIAVLQSAAVLVGRSERPPLSAPLFEARSDADTTKALLRIFQEISPSLPPSVENLMECYLQAVGSTYLRVPGRSLADLMAPSALFTVLLPAYLQANRQNPARALRELSTLPSAESPTLREAWRVAAYTAIRLLQGAQPDLALLQELRRTFVHSPMLNGVNQLIELQLGLAPARRQDILQEWTSSKDARARVLLGLYAFMNSPRDIKGALQAVPFTASDPHQIAERVAGMLAALGFGREAEQTVASARIMMLPLADRQLNEVEAAMKESENPPPNPLLEVMETVAQPGYWPGKVEAKLGSLLLPAQRAQLREGLSRLHPDLVRILGSAAEDYSAEALAAILHDMKVVQLSNRPALSDRAPKPVPEPYYESLASDLRQYHRSLFQSEMGPSVETLTSKLRQLPEAAVALLGYWSQNPGTMLLMARRLGLPGLPEEQTLLEAYRTWDGRSPDSE